MNEKTPAAKPLCKSRSAPQKKSRAAKEKPLGQRAQSLEPTRGDWENKGIAHDFKRIYCFPKAHQLNRKPVARNKVALAHQGELFCQTDIAKCGA